MHFGTASDHRSAYTAHVPDAAVRSCRSPNRRHDRVPSVHALLALVYASHAQWESASLRPRTLRWMTALWIVPPWGAKQSDEFIPD
jgi:hypothetical protein